jgi:DNA-binding NtrC family response regulator
MLSSPFLSSQKLDQAQLKEPEKLSKSVLMRDLFTKILCIAKTNNPVIIIGEVGAGKERLAKIIHENSSRAQNAFYSFYCVDVKEEEYREAFREQLQFDEEHLILKYNALEKACGGIIYLDQFSELSSQLMHKITHSFVKGSEQLYRHNVRDKPRLLLTMNLESCRDLFHTPVWDKILQLLNPIVVMLPPLRERKEDLPLMINYYIQNIKERRREWKYLKLSPPALRKCLNYNWPGNIRQLKNALLQGAILSHGKTIESNQLPFSMSWKLPYTLGKNEKY